MKKIFTIISVLTLMGGIAQQGELHFEGQPVGATFAIDSTTSAIDHFQMDMYIVNTGSVPLEISFTRVRDYHKNGWSDQLCDDLVCFPVDNASSWDRPVSPALTIPVGDSSIFQPKVYPNGVDGCSIYSYVVEGQGKVAIDNITITYTIGGVNCFLGQEELEEELQYSVYPNPVNDILNINMTGKNTTIEIFDIVGKKVTRMDLLNGKNQLNVESLKSGVYFYSIMKNGDLIETKKIVVR